MLTLSGHLLSYKGQGMLAEPYGTAEIEVSMWQILKTILLTPTKWYTALAILAGLLFVAFMILWGSGW